MLRAPAYIQVEACWCSDRKEERVSLAGYEMDDKMLGRELPIIWL
jgi:hypothetical protein